MEERSGTDSDGPRRGGWCERDGEAGWSTVEGAEIELTWWSGSGLRGSEE